MRNREWMWTLVLSAILVLPLLFIVDHNTEIRSPEPPTTSQPVTGEHTGGEQEEPATNPTPTESAPQPAPEPPPAPAPSPPPIVWGVDSATKVDAGFYQCVVANYGQPTVYGRYLETKEGVSSGLTIDEAAFLHSQGVKIIPIFNHFTNATTYENGVAEAQQAIAFGQNLGIPAGVAIFADIEPSYPVDEAFIRGWVETMLTSPYKPGIYGVFKNDSTLTPAYQAAITNNPNIPGQTFIWSSNPEPGVTPQAQAPPFQPGAPENVNVSIWQYGIDGQTCNIDTNLLQGDVLNYLW